MKSQKSTNIRNLITDNIKKKIGKCERSLLELAQHWAGAIGWQWPPNAGQFLFFFAFPGTPIRLWHCACQWEGDKEEKVCACRHIVDPISDISYWSESTICTHTHSFYFLFLLLALSTRSSFLLCYCWWTGQLKRKQKKRNCPGRRLLNSLTPGDPHKYKEKEVTYWRRLA